MGALFGTRSTPATEVRSGYLAPPNPFISSGSAAVPTVTSLTAAQSIAVRSSIDLIASLGSELTPQVWRERRGTKEQVDPTEALLDPAGDGSGVEDWAYRWLYSALVAGNVFGMVVDSARDHIAQCDLLAPHLVSPRIVDGTTQWTVNGKSLQPGDTLKHWRVNPLPGYLLGLSPIEYHATTIGVSLATSRFGRQWFADGLHPSGLLSNEKDLSGQQADTALARVNLKRGTNEPIVLGGGWSWENIQITPEESQFLETMGFTEAQCARIYGPGMAEILGYETGSKMTYSNIVDRRQDLLVLSINKWLKRLDRALTAFVPRGSYVRLNRDGLLEATTLQRYQAHASALSAGWKTANEVRLLEGLKPLAGGDVLDPVGSDGDPAPIQ